MILGTSPSTNWDSTLSIVLVSFEEDNFDNMVKNFYFSSKIFILRSDFVKFNRSCFNGLFLEDFGIIVDVETSYSEFISVLLENT